MQSHESFTKCACQTEYEVIELKTSSGTCRVGLVAVPSNEPNLYKPGAVTYRHHAVDRVARAVMLDIICDSENGS